MPGIIDDDSSISILDFVLQMEHWLKYVDHGCPCTNVICILVTINSTYVKMAQSLLKSSILENADICAQFGREISSVLEEKT